jgi:uncharacterized membrane protein
MTRELTIKTRANSVVRNVLLLMFAAAMLGIGFWNRPESWNAMEFGLVLAVIGAAIGCIGGLGLIAYKRQSKYSAK